ncbi:hypothetical protein ACWDA7_09745 [Streptomyces sp. NPDC001156]
MRVQRLALGHEADAGSGDRRMRPEHLDPAIGRCRQPGRDGEQRLHHRERLFPQQSRRRYRGLANEFPGQVSAPPKKPQDDACEGDERAWREQRRRQSPRRIRVAHTNAEYQQWHPLQRCTRRRETYVETHLAIVGLVSDRSARRPISHQHSTELAPLRQLAC